MKQNYSMGKPVEFICLANSRKLKGRCIAGKCIETNMWIRPVNMGSSISINEVSCIKCLDIVNFVPTIKADPGINTHQTENWEYCSDAGFLNVASYKSNVDILLDTPRSLWGDGDRVREVDVYNVYNSLLFIRCKNLELYVNNNCNNKKQLRGRFQYNQFFYDFVVTDVDYERELLPDYDVGRIAFRSQNVYLTVSLGELYNGAAYKLIANILI